MPFDPSKPAEHSDLSSQEMRDQFNALKALIDAVPGGPPGAPGPGLNFRGDWVGSDTYTPGDVIFHDGQAFVAIGVSAGTTPEGDITHWRTLSIAGPPGEVTNLQLASQIAAALVGTARNPSGITSFSGTFSDPPTQGEMNAFAAYVESLRLDLLRAP